MAVMLVTAVSPAYADTDTRPHVLDTYTISSTGSSDSQRIVNLSSLPASLSYTDIYDMTHQALNDGSQLTRFFSKSTQVVTPDISIAVPTGSYYLSGFYIPKGSRIVVSTKCVSLSYIGSGATGVYKPDGSTITYSYPSYIPTVTARSGQLDHFYAWYGSTSSQSGFYWAADGSYSSAGLMITSGDSAYTFYSPVTSQDTTRLDISIGRTDSNHYHYVLQICYFPADHDGEYLKQIYDILNDSGGTAKQSADQRISDFTSSAQTIIASEDAYISSFSDQNARISSSLTDSLAFQGWNATNFLSTQLQWYYDNAGNTFRLYFIFPLILGIAMFMIAKKGGSN